MRISALVLASLVPAALVGCDYDIPTIPQYDAFTGNSKPLTNGITGEIVLAVPSENIAQVVIFVADIRNPMPPKSTGSPKAVATIPASAFNTGTNGLRSASFSVSGVPDGDYYVTAFMDMDGNFNPLSLTPNVTGPMAGATCGDIAGAHLRDLDTGEFATVSVYGGSLVEDVVVTLGSTFPVERPSFSIKGFEEGADEKEDNYIDSVKGAADTTSQTFKVTSIGVHSAIYDIVGPDQMGLDPCASFLPLYGADADGDGIVDPHPTYEPQGLGLVWPRAFLTYLGEQRADGTFDNGLGVGEKWAAEAVPSPSYLFTGQAQAGVVNPKTEMTFNWLPGARHFADAADIEGEVVLDVAQIPKGLWGVTLISFTGQTWNVPNDLWRFDATDPSFDPASQNEWLVVE